MLIDYFRMPDDDAAIALMGQLDEGPVSVDDASIIDVITVKNIDPEVILGQLVSLARGVEWDVDTVEVELVWSVGEQEGPVLMSLDDATRDTLAGIERRQMADLSARWGRIEELARGGARFPTTGCCRSSRRSRLWHVAPGTRESICTAVLICDGPGSSGTTSAGLEV